ncbi:MAG: hypothetical protein IJT25_00415 [Clostridia bacterium]|nr:hypothetical protein [Clostridia bacterium]
MCHTILYSIILFAVIYCYNFIFLHYLYLSYA